MIKEEHLRSNSTVGNQQNYRNAVTLSPDQIQAVIGDSHSDPGNESEEDYNRAIQLSSDQRIHEHRYNDDGPAPYDPVYR